MRLIEKTGEKFVFVMGKRERRLLEEVLRHFPLVPVSHHKLMRAGPGLFDPGNQKLLEEAMSGQKDERKGRVQKWLGDKQRFVPEGNGVRMVVSREEMEWLLQVLNDVRVGSWLILGCPDPDEGKEPEMNESTAKYLLLMELSGHFECVMLEALEG